MWKFLYWKKTTLPTDNSQSESETATLRPTPTVLKSCHDEQSTGHLGRNRTLEKVEKRYNWPGLRRNVIQYVRTCPFCQSRKAKTLSPGEYMEICPVSRPFEKVGIDILSPFPTSKNGMKSIIVAVDYITKWAETRALPFATAKDAANFFV